MEVLKLCNTQYLGLGAKVRSSWEMKICQARMQTFIFHYVALALHSHLRNVFVKCARPNAVHKCICMLIANAFVKSGSQYMTALHC